MGSGVTSWYEGSAVVSTVVRAGRSLKERIDSRSRTVRYYAQHSTLVRVTDRLLNRVLEIAPRSRSYRWLVGTDTSDTSLFSGSRVVYWGSRLVGDVRPRIASSVNSSVTKRAVHFLGGEASEIERRVWALFTLLVTVRLLLSVTAGSLTSVALAGHLLAVLLGASRAYALRS